MTFGVCTMVVTDPGSLTDVSEILILEESGQSGSLFVGGEEECTELAHMPISEAARANSIVDAKTVRYPQKKSEVVSNDIKGITDHALSRWGGGTVKVVEKKLRIVTKEARLNLYTYFEMIGEFCSRIAEQEEEVLAGISQIGVFNAHNHQGFWFEGATAECLNYSFQPVQNRQQFIAFRTHTH